MRIKLREISIRDVVKGYVDSAEAGVVAFGGKLNIRPAYQREFVYKDKQRDEVIKTVRQDFPLNVMYWIITSEDGSKIDLDDPAFDLYDPKYRYEVLDGQQSTLSICEYVEGNFSIDYRAFHNLTETEQEQILKYPLMIYICEGTDKEKLDWFKIINIAGEKLTSQELRNAVYTGQWLTEAKKYFSKTGCPAYGIADKYMSGSTIRQDYLETALTWISDRDGIVIEDYMSKHQHDTNANDLWLYFQSVINWVKATFPVYRKKEMQGLDWGILYNKYKDNSYDPATLEKEIVELISDDDVTKTSGIYEYLLSGKDTKRERCLSIRKFSDKIAKATYEKQNHKCPYCLKKGIDKEYAFEEMEADHITPWSKGGHTVAENCQMLCKDCNRTKSDT